LTESSDNGKTFVAASVEIVGAIKNWQKGSSRVIAGSK